MATNKRVSTPRLLADVGRRLAANKRVRRTLPGGGRLHIDRQLPFLCVYRRPSGRQDAGTARLVKGEASYLVADEQRQAGVEELVAEVARTLSAQFGAFLVLEVWAGPDGGEANDPAVPVVLPSFAIHAPPAASMNRAVEALGKRLRRVKVLKHGVQVVVRRDGKSSPPGMRPLLKVSDCRQWNCSQIGISVPPVYRRPQSNEEFPLILRSLRRSLGLAIRQCCFEFALSQTTHRPPHYHSLGRRAVVKVVWEIDRQLAAVSDQFDYLLQVTPVNADAAWRQFQRDRFEHAPEFHYRPQPIDPSLLKRELYRIPIERVEDPAIQRLFREKQEELELKISMIRDRDTPRFLHQSLQLFGGVDERLLAVAHSVLDQPTRRSRDTTSVDAKTFAARAEEEIAYYRQRCPQFSARVEIADDINGLIVSRGSLLINAALKLPAARVPALLAHEVGTHLLTYYNGKSQPFRQLYSGMAGYEELQEGLAVLSEVLVGGLDHARLRQLAARVLAVWRLTEGSPFVETFREIDRTYDFTQRTAYNIVMRVYRGGGLTKDAVYLRGLLEILRYVRAGGDLAPLFVGKMAVVHIPLIKELQYRKVLSEAPALPRFLQDERALGRLQALREGDASDLAGLTHLTGPDPSNPDPSNPDPSNPDPSSPIPSSPIPSSPDKKCLTPHKGDVQ